MRRGSTQRQGKGMRPASQVRVWTGRQMAGAAKADRAGRHTSGGASCLRRVGRGLARSSRQALPTSTPPHRCSQHRDEDMSTPFRSRRGIEDRHVSPAKSTNNFSAGRASAALWASLSCANPGGGRKSAVAVAVGVLGRYSSHSNNSVTARRFSSLWTWGQSGSGRAASHLTSVA